MENNSKTKWKLWLTIPFLYEDLYPTRRIVVSQPRMKLISSYHKRARGCLSSTIDPS